MKYFSIVNWKKHQHYKDRCPPWIKVQNALLDHYEYGLLPDASKSHLIGIWLLASRHDNKLPFDPVWVGQRIQSKTKVNLNVLQVSGFIELYQDASTALADCNQSACLEGETEEEVEKKTPTPKALPSEALELAKRLGRWIRERDPGNKSITDAKHVKTFNAWADAIDKLNRIDGREWVMIEAVIDWCQADEFWQNNILSGAKLRGKFSQLKLKMQSEGPTNGPQISKHNADAHRLIQKVKEMEARNGTIGSSEPGSRDIKALPSV